MAHNQLTPADAAWLANSPQLTGLRRLDLSYNNLHSSGVRALLGSPFLTELTHLYLRGVGIEQTGAVSLAAAAQFPRLAVLDLENNALGDEGARAFAEAPSLATTRLILNDSEVSRKCQQELRHRHGVDQAEVRDQVAERLAEQSFIVGHQYRPGRHGQS